MNKSKLSITCKPTVPCFPTNQFNDLNTSTNTLAAITAVHKDRRRITKELDDHVAKTKNSYFSIDQLKKIIG